MIDKRIALLTKALYKIIRHAQKPQYEVTREGQRYGYAVKIAQETLDLLALSAEEEKAVDIDNMYQTMDEKRRYTEACERGKLDV